MAGHDDRYSGGVPQNWGEEKAPPPAVVYPHDMGPVAGSRRGTALLVLGVTLGATVVATMFLGLIYMRTADALKYERTEREKLSSSQFEKESLYRANYDEARRRFEDLRRAYDDLQRENTRLAAVKGVKAKPVRQPPPAPPSTDPFSRR